MINFAALEESVASHGVSIGELGTAMQQLETQVATLASKEAVSEFEARSTAEQATMQRALDQLDATLKAQAGIVEQMPTIQRELVSQMAEIETKLVTEVGELHQRVMGRFGTIEAEVFKKASVEEVEKIGIEVVGRVRREDLTDLEATVGRIRDEAAGRIDGVAERTFAMRKELDAALESMRQGHTEVKARIDERTASLEEQSQANAAYLARSEKVLASKVATEELGRATEAWYGKLAQLRAVLQAQMDAVRSSAERGSEEFAGIVERIGHVCMRHELDPLRDLIETMQSEVRRGTSHEGGGVGRGGAGGVDPCPSPHHKDRRSTPRPLARQHAAATADPTPAPRPCEHGRVL